MKRLRGWIIGALIYATLVGLYYYRQYAEWRRSYNIGYYGHDVSTDFSPVAWVVGILLFAGLLNAVMRHNVIAPGRQLHAKVVSLGNVIGKTKSEIISVAGNPTSISVAGNGRLLLQWQATGCHMALIFNGEVCEEITHQYFASR